MHWFHRNSRSLINKWPPLVVDQLGSDQISRFIDHWDDPFHPLMIQGFPCQFYNASLRCCGLWFACGNECWSLCSLFNVINQTPKKRWNLPIRVPLSMNANQEENKGKVPGISFVFPGSWIVAFISMAFLFVLVVLKLASVYLIRAEEHPEWILRTSMLPSSSSFTSPFGRKWVIMANQSLLAWW